MPGSRTAALRATFRWEAVALAVLVAGGTACSAAKGPPPEPALSHSLKAQEELRPILAQWAHASATERVAMAPAIAKFGVMNGGDETARIADVLLAWIALEKGELQAAEQQASRARVGAPPGTVSDLAAAVEGAALRRQGKADAALFLLLPLVSKLIDGWARALLNEEVVRAAVLAHHSEDALALMRVWLRESSPDERDHVREVIAEGLRQAVTPEDMLDVLAKPKIDAEEDAEIRKLMTARLAQVARERNDRQLAQRLLTQSQGLLGEEGEKVAQLATGAGRARVEARTVGLLLDLGDDNARRRGAEIVQGVAFGLGIPGSAARLVSRDGHGSRAQLEDALSALIADGASIIIAGSDEASSEIATAFAESHHVPVLLLEPPVRTAPGNFAFVLGTGASAREAALIAALTSRGATPVTVVTDDPDRPRDGKPDTVIVRGCGEAPSVAKDGARRGSGKARADGPGLVLAARTECSRDALVAAGSSARVAAGFEADGLPLPPGGLVATAGSLPFEAGAAVLRAFAKDHPKPPSYWTALGRDAAVLAWTAVQNLPAQATEDPNEVAARRSRVLTALGAAEVPLWSTEATGFHGAHALTRTLGVREVARPAR